MSPPAFLCLDNHLLVVLSGPTASGTSAASGSGPSDSQIIVVEYGVEQ